MVKYLKSIWAKRDLRKKILFTIVLLVVYKMMTHIPVPGANLEALRQVIDSAEILGVYSLLMGGSLENFSIVLMGLAPYINAAIIIQLLTVIVPKLEALSKEGQRGQRLINKYTRWLTLPLAFLQSFGMIALLNNIPGQAGANAGVEVLGPGMLIPAMFTVTAGTLFIMWLGELISEKGFGNGISLIIFASIAAGIPTLVGQLLSLSTGGDALLPLAILVVVTVALTAFVVWFTEAQRNIPITYAGHGAKGAEKSALPIRVSQAGMIPIIFAVSMVTFPSIVGQFMALPTNAQYLQDIGNWIATNFTPNNPNLWYIIIYFLLVIFFAYFYVSITFKPEQMAETIQKRGGFIPGKRPGKETAEYLGQISSRLNFWGGTFVALVAVFPYLFDFATSQAGTGSVPLLISGAGLIIIVGVVLDMHRKVKVELVAQDYDKYY